MGGEREELKMTPGFWSERWKDGLDMTKVGETPR